MLSIAALSIFTSERGFGSNRRVLLLAAAIDDESSLLHDDSSLLTASEILLRVYDETRGLRWDQNTNWLQNTDVCSWYGVTCYDDSVSDQRRAGHVQKLDLSGNRLLGSIPQEVFQLPYLESIDVRDNTDLSMGFGGIGEAQYLKEIAFSNTNVKSLSGIQAAAQLQSIHMTSLGLTGSLPSEIFQMKQLKGIFANYNKFTSSIPSNIGQLKQLRELYLFASDLTGQIPSEIGLLSNLKVATLAENAFGGTLPTELNLCTQLTTLAINRASGLEKGLGISGRLPSLSQMEDLKDLRLQNQLLSGPIPPDFLASAPRTELVKVELSQNLLTGALPRGLANLKRLDLDLSDNQIRVVPDEVCNSPSIAGWQDGNVGTIGCNGLLCPPGTTASKGRATPDQPCMPCDGVQYWGTSRCASSTTTTSMGYSEREVLINLYNRMGGRYWKHSDEWLNPAEDICEWYGVECVNGKVTGLQLKNNDLSSSPPTELYSLPELKHLVLEDNSIDFQFKGIGKAKKLETLLLSGCDMSSLDNVEELGSTTIRKLSLASNSLEGPLPAELFNVASLELLDLSHNKFTGPLLSQIGNLHLLEEFLFSRNKLDGQIPSEIESLVRLRKLIGSDNNFSGSLPTALNALTRLEVLSLHQTNSLNGISGPLLPLRNLGQLTSLQLDSNNLSGSLPDDLLRNTEKGDSAVEVRLSDNNLEGDMPEAWASRFQDLFVDLSGNKITGIGGDVCNMESWNQGSVGRFSCDGIACPPGKFNEFGRQTGPDAFCRTCAHRSSVIFFGSKTCDDSTNAAIQQSSELGLLKELFDTTNGINWKKNGGWMTSNDPCDSWTGIECNADGKVISIDLESNGLQGTPSSSIFKLNELRSLGLKDNQIAFSFEGIDQASNLAILTLSGTKLDSVAGISRATTLTELHLTDNNLKGPLPHEILQLTNLKRLYANYNQLSSTIPPGISALSHCEDLFLFNNRLTGQIPGSIGLLSQLKHLSLAENNFSGTLPPEINDLINLEVLSIQREGGTDEANVGVNQEIIDDFGAGIGGPLPPLNNLKYLKKLYIGANSLTGSIPYNFLDGVEDKAMSIEVDLISNRLTGSIPASLTQFGDLSLYVAGNRISGIADGLCRKDSWMLGAVGNFQCNAILCPPGTSSVYGRQKDSNSICTSCATGLSAEFYGSFNCLGDEDRQSLSERTILEDFYRATEGDNWKNSMGWLDSDESFCTWFGVTCASGIESVASIHLPDNGLRGSIPAEMHELALKELNFAHNQVEMSFQGIAKAGMLEYLQLDDTGINSLAGLEMASTLKLLHIADNNIESSEFSKLRALTSLESLDISNNEVKSFPFLGNHSNLKYLACSQCSISGPIPAWLTSLNELEHVDFEGNLLTGALPPSVSDLSSLKFLNLADQQSDGGSGLTGTLPAFAGMPALQELYLQSNKLTGSIPETFLSDVNVEGRVAVDLRANALSGSIPEGLLHISDLDIYLASNEIASIPESVCSAAWNGKVDSTADCNHILCPLGTFNAIGRATSSLPCTTCMEEGYAKFLGSTGCGPEFEKSLVYGLFESLGGRGWKQSDGWQDHDDHCSWAGVTCYEGGFRDGFVQKIDLSNNGLRGTLDVPVWGLVHLKELDLRKNDIVIPFEGIENAQSLVTLQLSETKLSSLNGISAGPNLKYLHFTSCKITGPIPDELYEMTQLKALYANYNQLEGTVSTQIGQLSRLTELYLFHNSLNGQLPSELGMLESVEILSLGENKFTGSLPIELNSLQELRVLSLQSEETVPDASAFFSVVHDLGLRGSLIPFNNTPKLQELYLGFNHLEGDIPNDFLMGIDDTSITIRVDLSSNLFHGAIPASFVRFDDLRLDLTGNSFREIPDEFCTKSDWFDGAVAAGCDALLCPPGTFNAYGRRIGAEGCEECNFRGSAIFYGSRMCGAVVPQFMSDSLMLQEVFSSTGGLSWDKSDNWLRDDVSICEWYGVTCDDQQRVSELSLDGNNLVGLVPSIVFYLPNLRKLNMGRNQLWAKFDDIQYSKLEELHLHETNVNSLVGISNADSLKFLDLKKTQLDGKTIPDELYKLSNLTVLELSECGLTSTISSEIGKLKNLVTLLLDRNDLTGQMPSTIGKLTALEDFFLTDNRFFGTLPPEMENLTSLKSLFLDSYNENGVGISGPLLSFSTMPKLRDLHLGSNSLTGPIPSNLLAGVDSFKEVVEVDLASNHLTGSIPSQLAAFGSLNLITTDNHIEFMDNSLCVKASWLQGSVESFSCDGILCAVGTFSPNGRQISQDAPCMPCVGSSVPPFMGQTSCMSDTKERERKILELFFNAMNGKHWRNADGWLEEHSDYCSWYGIECADSTVQTISLASNNLMGTPPQELFELRNLQNLWLYSNPIDFRFDGIGKALRLEHLRLDSTGLKSLEGIGEARSLVEVDVRFNRLSGELPDLSKLQHLQSFSCSANNLSGSLPSLSANKNLISFRASGNSFSGLMPPFDSHPEIRTIDVSQNDLVGLIPANLMAAVDPQASIFLDLSSNRFTGGLPATLTRFSDVTIYIRDNQIEELPAAVCSKQDWNGGDVGLAGCDGILCPPQTFSPATGRASHKGSKCERCDNAHYFGSTTCGAHHSGANTLIHFRLLASLASVFFCSLL